MVNDGKTVVENDEDSLLKNSEWMSYNFCTELQPTKFCFEFVFADTQPSLPNGKTCPNMWVKLADNKTGLSTLGEHKNKIKYILNPCLDLLYPFKILTYSSIFA